MTAQAPAAAGLAASVTSALSETRSSVRVTWRNRNLRRVQLAFAGSNLGDWAYATAVAVWAYGVGGATAVGIWTAARMVAMAVVAPLAAALADRLPRKRVMIGADVVRAVLVLAATACLVADTPAAPVFVLATAGFLVGSVFRPSQAALLPSLVDSPEQLTASNGTSSTIESLGFFVGPALGAVLLTVTDVETVFVLNAVTFAWSAALVAGVHPRPRDPGAHSADGDDGEDDGHDRGALAEMVAGFTTIARDPDLRLASFLICAQTVIAGASAVFAVLLAVDVLGTGAKGVGYINSALGVGAVLGAFVALSRAARNTLAADLALGTLLWSLPLLLVAWQPVPAVVLGAMALLGFGNPLVDVSFDTIVQRITPDRVLGRVFGALEGLLIGGAALGAGLMPVVAATVGLRPALALIALLVGVPVLLLLPATRRLDARLRPPAGLDLLRRIPMFVPLGPARLESIARQLARVVLPAGYVVLREGEDSDRFFLIESGEVEVTQDGVVLRHEGAGEFFGEIGLLRDLPRTATVTTTADTVLLTLSRAHFLAAVAGSDESRMAADDIVARRMTA